MLILIVLFFCFKAEIIVLQIKLATRRFASAFTSMQRFVAAGWAFAGLLLLAGNGRLGGLWSGRMG